MADDFDKNEEEYQGPSEVGNVWTSYSDLFMGIAVVFLILFVFAMMSAGVTQLKVNVDKKQAEEMLRGKLPQKLIEKNKKERNAAELALKEMTEKKELIKENMKQLSTLIVSVENKEQLLDQMYKDQLEKEVIINETRSNLLQREEDIKQLNRKREELILAKNQQADILKAARNEMESLKQHTKKLNQIIADRNKVVSSLKAQTSDLTYESERQRKIAEKSRTDLENLSQVAAARSARINELEKARGDFLSKIKGLEDNVRAKEEQLSAANRKIKDVKSSVEAVRQAREEVAAQITQAMKAAGVDIYVDPKTGAFEFQMDDAFYFKNASAQLSPGAMAKIKKVLPIYAATLFGHPKISHRITAITVTGHASPRYRKSFVDPLAPDYKAFSYNLNLSLQRARQVAEFAFGESTGTFQHKTRMKKMLRVAGRGFLEPVELAPGVEPVEPCGKYNCPLSRRVIVNFDLEESSEKRDPIDEIKQRLSH